MNKYLVFIQLPGEVGYHVHPVIHTALGSGQAAQQRVDELIWPDNYHGCGLLVIPVDDYGRALSGHLSAVFMETGLILCYRINKRKAERVSLNKSVQSNVVRWPPK